MNKEIEGSWTYRSYVNDPALVAGNAQKALRDIFGEGVFSLRQDGDALSGTFDMGGGLVLDVTGQVERTGAVVLAGVGRDGTRTAGWEYDYHAAPAFTWPNGVDQIPALVGSLIRAKPHGGSPAGFVASFIAVRQP